jgi:PhoPQ-activated pathogenicity-related protein
MWVGGIEMRIYIFYKNNWRQEELGVVEWCHELALYACNLQLPEEKKKKTQECPTRHGTGHSFYDI